VLLKGEGDHSLAHKKFQDFPGPPKRFFRTVSSPAMLNYKQQLLTLYIQCDSTIHRKTFITSGKETVPLVHSRDTSDIYLHLVCYTQKARWLSWTTGKFQDFTRPNSFSRKFRKKSRTYQNFPGDMETLNANINKKDWSLQDVDNWIWSKMMNIS